MTRPVAPLADSTGVRDHLFISYAWEDRALADWLTLRLTAEGYSVWCDRFKMLGGERWPKRIDEAIKSRTFRLIALLSRFSIEKENPGKERTLALNLAKERGEEDFLIPLNLDGLSPTQIPWTLVESNYIGFSASWADGLSQLLKKLESLNAPRPRVDDGKSVAASAGAYLPRKVIQGKPETLYTNCLEFESLPDSVQLFQFTLEPTVHTLEELSQHWAFYTLDDNRALAFEAFESAAFLRDLGTVDPALAKFLRRPCDG